jgi:hypothetical protein
VLDETSEHQLREGARRASAGLRASAAIMLILLTTRILSRMEFSERTRHLARVLAVSKRPGTVKCRLSLCESPQKRSMKLVWGLNLWRMAKLREFNQGCITFRDFPKRRGNVIQEAAGVALRSHPSGYPPEYFVFG